MRIRKVELENGKYTLCFNEQTGEFEALRGGEPWRNLCGDKMVLCAMQKIEAQDDEIKRLREALAFYADENTYTKAVDINFGGRHIYVIDNDEGKIARQALKGGEIR